MSAEVPARAGAGSALAGWSAKALLITAGVLLVGGAIWYGRAATVPLIVAALVSTQLLPLIGWATGRGVPRALAITAAERAPQIADVPTMAEAGVPNVVVSSWFALANDSRTHSPWPMVTPFTATSCRANRGPASICGEV